MTHATHDQQFGGSAAENYERYFVPAIGAPLAGYLLQTAALRPGERMLDVACGTGIVARVAAEGLGNSGRIAGTDVSPGMLDVARAAAHGMPIEWREADAASLPYADEDFDVVLCQMGLQFVPNKLAALREMRRVLARGGRIALNLPGPAPGPMAVLADALARHVDPKLASFVHLVFSFYEASEVRDILDSAGFRDVDVQSVTRELGVPPADEFLWQYIYSTPLGEVLANLDAPRQRAIEHDVCAQWPAERETGATILKVGVTTATARRD